MDTSKKGKKDVSDSYNEEYSKDKGENKIEETKEESPVTNMVKIKFEEGEEKKLLAQFQVEHKFATRGIKGWIDKNLKRLKLHNNQMRNESFLGEPLIYSHMDTWLSALYNDRMDQTFDPRDEGDIPTAENLLNTAKYDYELMGMDELNRDQDWDSLFFAYGLKDWLEFDYKKKCPSPYVLDPLTFYYDTLATSVDGNVSGKGGMRFLGWDVIMNKMEIKKNPLLGEEGCKKVEGSWIDEEMSKGRARKERMEAMGGTYEHMNEDVGDNSVFELIHWRTSWKGKRIAMYVSPDKKSILGATVLPYDKENDYWTWWVAVKKYSPVSHSFKGVSLLDNLEDKQRKKAELVNDSFKLARATVYGSYGYDKNMIDNLSDLAFGYDKWIPVNGNPQLAISPIRKDVPNTGLIDNMLNYIDVSAQKASATSELQQGVMSKDNRTASELNLVAQMTQTRYSLVAKSFAQGDRDDWRLWYMSYKINFQDGLGKKVIRIGGSGSKQYRPLQRKDLICKIDPDIRVDSMELSRARRQREFAMFSETFNLIIQDPQADKRAGIKHLLYLSGLERETVDTILPPTSDEMIARDQNDMINKGQEPPFLANDNHLVHIRMHREAIENKIKENHIKLHLQAIKMIQENPALDPSKAEAGLQAGETSPSGTGIQGGEPARPQMSNPASREATLNNQGR